MLRQIGDKDQKIQNLEALLQKSKEIVTQLETEREDLCAKIQAGEGETAVLNQLKEKNHALQGQVEQENTHTLYTLSTSVVHSLLFSLIILELTYTFFMCLWVQRSHS